MLWWLYIVSLFTKLCRKKVESRVDVGPFKVDVFVDGKICRINEEVVEEEGK